MPGTPKCEQSLDKDKCQLFEVEYFKYITPANVAICHLDATQAEFVISIKGTYPTGGPLWGELLLIESNLVIAFADPDIVQPSKSPVFQTEGYFRVIKKVDTRATRQFKILVKKMNAKFQGSVTIFCKFRHGRDFPDSCAWKDKVHTLSITIDVE